MAIVWPATLPQAVQVGYTESLGLNTLRTPMDSGPAKIRFRGRKPSVLGVSFILSKTQVATLETFVTTTIHGVQKFNFPHPRTGVVVKVRIMPGNDNQYYNLEHLAEGFYKVSMQLEVLL